jgi:hypothetical protein
VTGARISVLMLNVSVLMLRDQTGARGSIHSWFATSANPFYLSEHMSLMFVVRITSDLVCTLKTFSLRFMARGSTPRLYAA